MTAVGAQNRLDPDRDADEDAAGDADTRHRRLAKHLRTIVAQRRRMAMRQFAALVGGIALANCALVAVLTAAGVHWVVVVATAIVGLVSTGALIGRMLMIHRDGLRQALMEPISSAVPSREEQLGDAGVVRASQFAALGLVPEHDDSTIEVLIETDGRDDRFFLAQVRLMRTPDAGTKEGRRIVFRGLLIAMDLPGDDPEPQAVLDALPSWGASSLRPRMETDAGRLLIAMPLARELFDAAALLGPAARSLEMADRLVDLAVLPRRLANGQSSQSLI